MSLPRASFTCPDEWALVGEPGPVARRGGPVDWSQLRVPPSPVELTLQLATRRWLESLPPEVVPHALAERYARIANQLARHWDDPRRTFATFDDLLVDKRGGRKGFPPAVRSDLERLHAWYRSRQAPHPQRGSREDRWAHEPERTVILPPKRTGWR